MACCLKLLPVWLHGGILQTKYIQVTQEHFYRYMYYVQVIIIVTVCGPSTPKIPWAKKRCITSSSTMMVLCFHFFALPHCSSISFDTRWHTRQRLLNHTPDNSIGTCTALVLIQICTVLIYGWCHPLSFVSSLDTKHRVPSKTQLGML